MSFNFSSFAPAAAPPAAAASTAAPAPLSFSMTAPASTAAPAPLSFGIGAVATTVPAAKPSAPSHGPLYQKLNEFRRAYAPYYHQVQAQGGRVEFLASEKEKKEQQAAQQQVRDNGDCRFPAHFYDPRDPNAAAPSQAQAQLDAMASAMALDRRMDEQNPDPEHLDAKTIFGIEQLVRRYDRSVEDSQKLQKDIESIQEIVSGLSACEMRQRDEFEDKKRRQSEQYGRLLRLLARVDKLRMQDKPLDMDEYKFREKAESMLQHLKQQHSHLTELLNFQSQHDLIRDEYVDSLSDADLEVLYSAMARQHEGLQHVSDILERDMRDVQIVRRNVEQGARQTHR